MAAQKHKKCFWHTFFAFLNVYYPKTHLIKAPNSLDFSRPNGRLLENLKTGVSRNLFPPENYFKASSTVNFPKKSIQILEAWKWTKDMKLRQEFFLFHMSFYIWTQYNIKIWFGHLIGTSSKWHKFWGQNFKKSVEKAKKTEFYNFWALYFWIILES